MQDITPIIPKNKKQIESYGAGGFKINGEKFSGSIFLTPNKVIELNIKSVSDFSEEIISKIENEIFSAEIILIGYGEQSNFLQPSIEKILRSQKISIEYMDTGAACRTYNILLSEGREIAAILIAV